MKLINIIIGNQNFKAELVNSNTANLIYGALPFSSGYDRWGDEIYFKIDVNCELENDAKTILDVGDLAYYPNIPALCIFFGPTPISSGEEPEAAGPVNVFGKFRDFDVQQFREAVNNGGNVTIETI